MGRGIVRGDMGFMSSYYGWILCAAWTAGLTTPALAQVWDFRTAYALALAGSPDWQSQQAQAYAAAQARRLGLSKLLPRLDYSYSRARNRTILHQDQGSFGSITQRNDYGSYDSAFTLSQPIFDAAAYAQWREGKARARAAQYTLERARQALAVQLLQAYTSVLYAQDALALIEAQSRSLESDAQRSEQAIAAGEGTRTDALEVAARYQVIQAQLIMAQNQLEDSRSHLRQLVGPGWPVEARLAELDTKAALPRLDGKPDNLGNWYQLALRNNPELLAQRAKLEAARQHYRAAWAAHLPSLRFYARHELSSSNQDYEVGQRYNTNSVGIVVKVPLFAGGETTAQTARALGEKAAAVDQLAGAEQKLLNDVAHQYRTETAEFRLMMAYQRTLAAAAARLTATRRSMLGGERTALDVLDAERLWYQARRQLARARYDYLLAWLSLRWQAGVLSDDDTLRIAGLFNHAPTANPALVNST